MINLGKPSFKINEKIKKIIKKQFKTTKFNFFLSISDEKKYSVAYVILQIKMKINKDTIIIENIKTIFYALSNSYNYKITLYSAFLYSIILNGTNFINWG